MTNEKFITCRRARLVPALLLIASIWVGSTGSGWWFLSIPFIAVGWLGAVPNLNLANGILAYFSMVGGLILHKFHEPSGAAIAAGAAAGFYLSALEMRITAKPYILGTRGIPRTKTRRSSREWQPAITSQFEFGLPFSGATTSRSAKN
jgi:hypothetical protein